MQPSEWYYGLAGKQQGPVTAEQLAKLQADRVIDGNTLVWRAGMPNWQPLALLADFQLPAGQGRCAQCGQLFPQTEMIQYENAWICAPCKPVFVQKLKEGVGVGALPGMSVRRQGNQLVVLKDAALPHRCVKCNAPAEGTGLVRKLYWHSPVIYVLILCNVLIYAVVALVVRQRATITIGLCEKHWQARRRAVAIAWSIFGASILAFILAATMDTGWPAVFGVIGFFTAILWGLLGARMVYANKIDKERVWLGGVCPEYLASFPEWDGRS